MQTPSVPTGGLIAHRLADLSTGMKLFGIISFALLPLGMIALLASLASNRTADTQRRADLRVAVTESSRKLAAELGADFAALRAAAESSADTRDNGPTCARLETLLRARPTRKPSFALFGPDRAMICATPGFLPRLPAPELIENKPHAIVTADAVTVLVPEHMGRGLAVASYPARTLAEFVEPIGISASTTIIIADSLTELPLAAVAPTHWTASETYAVPIGLFGLNLRISVERAPISTAEWLSAFLPLLMWASAALIGFLVVDRLLIRPLAQLRRAVAGFAPGSGMASVPIRTPAREIRELAETFERVATTMAAHEASLGKALNDQVRLTREVHHRVKNNLQVVASLISLHARGAPSGPVAEAYASIQRRVDALAIVHRNHYAELEGSGGISAKALIGEIASNLRTGMATTGAAPPIAVQAAPLQLSQDVAVPVAFLITELVELSIREDRAAAIRIDLTIGEPPEVAWLTIASAALAAIGRTDGLVSAPHSRIVEGLARQLRAPLAHMPDAQGYRIAVPIFAA